MRNGVPLLLDVDGVLRVYEPPPPQVVPYAASFIRWAFDNFELKWFTSHTKREAAPGYGCDYYARLAGIDPEAVPHLRYLDENRNVDDKWTCLPSGFFVVVDDEAIDERMTLVNSRGGVCFAPNRKMGVTPQIAGDIVAVLAKMGIRTAPKPEA